MTVRHHLPQSHIVIFKGQIFWKSLDFQIRAHNYLYYQIPNIYFASFINAFETTPSISNTWARDLGVPLSEELWGRILYKFKISINSRKKKTTLFQNTVQDSCISLFHVIDAAELKVLSHFFWYCTIKVIGALRHK